MGKEMASSRGWYQSGKKVGQGINKNGLQSGVWMQYYESGEKKSERHFKEGKQVGVFITWNLNGQKLSESNYNKYGQLHGLLTEWYKNGLRDLFTYLGIENNMVVQRNGTQTERKN